MKLAGSTHCKAMWSGLPMLHTLKSHHVTRGNTPVSSQSRPSPSAYIISSPYIVRFVPVKRMMNAIWSTVFAMHSAFTSRYSEIR